MSNFRNFFVEDKEFMVEGVSDKDPYLNGIQGRFESKFQDFCKTFLQNDYIAFDIGANIGVTSIILSHYLNKGKIYAIEPGEVVYKLMQENLSNNNINNVVGYNYAISDSTTNVNFIENSAYGYIDISEINMHHNTEDNSIMAYAFDDLVEKMNLERLDFIKIDVEGFEPQFFEGAKKTLVRFNPIIYFELNSWCLMDHGKKDPIKFMKTITDSFKYVYRVNKKENSSIILEELNIAELHRILIHDNIVRFGSVNDIVITNDPNKIDLKLLRLNNKNDALRAENDALRAENDALRAENDALRTNMNNFVLSKSYKIASKLIKIASIINMKRS